MIFINLSIINEQSKNLLEKFYFVNIFNICVQLCYIYTWCNIYSFNFKMIKINI